MSPERRAIVSLCRRKRRRAERNSAAATTSSTLSLYYPLAALLGIRVLAVVTAAVGAFAFAVVVSREWGPIVRWSSRSFAVIWAGFILTGGFPFMLGAALALIGLVELQSGRRWSFAFLAVLTLAADPVALVLLIVVLAGAALAGRAGLRASAVPFFGLAVAVAVELVLLRLFPDGNRFPFAALEGVAALGFCVVGLACAWRVESARLLRYFFVVYGVAIVGAYLTQAPLDVSSHREARLIRSGRIGLRRVFTTRLISIYAVPRPRPIVTGPDHPALLALGGSRLLVRVSRRGTYRIAVRWSPYWRASTGCLTRTPNGLLRLETPTAAIVRISFDVDSASLLRAFTNTAPSCVP